MARDRVSCVLNALIEVRIAYPIDVPFTGIRFVSIAFKKIRAAE